MSLYIAFESRKRSNFCRWRAFVLMNSFSWTVRTCVDTVSASSAGSPHFTQSVSLLYSSRNVVNWLLIKRILSFTSCDSAFLTIDLALSEFTGQRKRRLEGKNPLCLHLSDNTRWFRNRAIFLATDSKRRTLVTASRPYFDLITEKSFIWLKLDVCVLSASSNSYTEAYKWVSAISWPSRWTPVSFCSFWETGRLISSRV